jgi:hypothetical protein
VAEELRG